jgi:hypothetical protein
MPDCQSGAVHSLVCGTIICIAVAGDFGVCHADCHEGECRKALDELGCSSGRSARLFRMKEAGEGGREDQPTDWLLHDYCAAWAILTTAFRRKAPEGARFESSVNEFGLTRVTPPR